MSGQGAKLATGWLELTVSTEGAEKSLLASVLPGAKRAGDTGGKSIGGGILAGVRAVAVPVLGIMAGIFSVKKLGALAGMGISRALNIQDATEKLTGLGHSATDVTNIMNSALKSVKGTAFGLDEAATVAASAVASGIKPGQELTKYLGLTADAAAIAGSSLSDMGQILNGVSSRGTAYTADLDQLASRGLPIFQWLQEEYGVTATQLSKMVSSGKVDAATFDKAISDHIGGAALSSGKTARGAFANVGAAVSRLGALFATPAVNAAPGLFNAVSNALDSLGVVLKPVADRFGKWLVPAIQGAVQWLGKLDFGKLIQSVAQMSPLVQILQILAPLWPAIGAAIGPILPLVAQFAGVLGTSLGQVLTDSLPGLTQLAGVLAGALSSALQGILPGLVSFTEFLGQNPSLIYAVIGALVAWKAITLGMAIAQGVATAATWLLNAAMYANPIGLVILGIAALIAMIVVLAANWGAVTSFVSGIWNGFLLWLVGAMDGMLAWWGGLWASVFGFVSKAWNNIVGFISGMQAKVIAILVGAGSWLINTGANLISGFLAGMRNGWNGLMSFLGGLPGKIGGFFAGAGSWLLQAGKNIVQGLLDGVRSLAGTVGKFFLSLLPGWIVGPFKAALGINSPSKVFAGYGVNIVQGLMGGISSKQSDLGSQVRSMVPLPDLSAPAAQSLQAGTTAGISAGRGPTVNQTIYVTEPEDPRIVGRKVGREAMRVLAGSI